MILVGIIVFVSIGLAAMILKMYKKAIQGFALVRTGFGNTKVSFSGLFVVPIIHKMETMDTTVKTIMIERSGKDGLVCKDNMRADIKVTFFVRVNPTTEAVAKVAQSLGCSRASDQRALEDLFDAKFSEALKTVGKHFDFVELYNSRAAFNDRIVEEIGKDLNGYVLDDCAIDYLEQTPLNNLDEKNILDAVGIKKIIELTSDEKIKSNLIEKEKEKVITKQNVEARETVLELEKQLAEKEAKQRREIETIRYTENAEIDRVREEEREKAERARIQVEEELEVAEQNKLRQVIVAKKNKERTDAIETERVLKDKELEATERQRVVELAQIEKEKALEEERKNIQDVIRERVSVEKAVVEEEEKIKDTKAIAEADREKTVAITNAEMEAEEALVKEIKAAEARKQAAEHNAQQMNIVAEAEQQASVKRAEAKKIMAEAAAAEVASRGMGEAQVIEAKAEAMQKQGESEAQVIEMKARAEAKGYEEQGLSEAKVIQEKAVAIETRGKSEAAVIAEKHAAEAKGIELKAVSEAKGLEEQGLSEARVIQEKASAEEARGMAEAKVTQEKLAAEAKGIEEKAEAMQKLDGVGREHEEFKLRLEKDKEIELAKISIHEVVAQAQAQVIAEGLKAAKIDIVGGETMFFDQIVGSIANGKKIDRMVDNSHVLEQVKDTFFGGDGNNGDFKENLRNFVDQFGISMQDIKDLSVANLLNKMAGQTTDKSMLAKIGQLLGVANLTGVADKGIDSLGIFK